MDREHLEKLQRKATNLQEELDRIQSEISSAIDELHNKMVDFAKLLEETL